MPMQPKPIAETVGPFFPKCLFFMYQFYGCRWKTPARMAGLVQLSYAGIVRQALIIIFSCITFAMAQENSSIPDLARLKEMTARFAPTALHVDRSSLPAGDRAALAKLIEAGQVVNHLFMQQMWS